MKGIFGSGTNDFLAVRVSSLVIFVYFAFLTFFIVSHTPLTFVLWTSLFENVLMKIATIIFLMSFAVHTWIGTWAIGSDYLTLARLGNFAVTLNKLYRIFCALIIGSITLWSILIVW